MDIRIIKALKSLLEANMSSFFPFAVLDYMIPHAWILGGADWMAAEKTGNQAEKSGICR